VAGLGGALVGGAAGAATASKVQLYNQSLHQKKKVLVSQACPEGATAIEIGVGQSGPITFSVVPWGHSTHVPNKRSEEACMVVGGGPTPEQWEKMTRGKKVRY